MATEDRRGVPRGGLWAAHLTVWLAAAPLAGPLTGQGGAVFLPPSPAECHRCPAPAPPAAPPTPSDA